MSDQHLPWTNRDFEHQDPQAYALLCLCACVPGEPLARDVLAMVPEHFAGPDEVERTARRVEGVLGSEGPDGSYVFRRPQQRDELLARLHTRGEYQRWVQRQLDYGEKTLQALRRAQIQPQEVSPYIVRTYGETLAITGAPREKLYALLCRPWADAWEWLGNIDGFATDAWRAFERAGAQPSGLGIQVRAALCIASTGHWTLVPAGLLAACLRAAVISPVQAMKLLPAHPWEEDERREALYSLLPHLPGPFASRALAELDIESYDPDEETGWSTDTLPASSLEDEIDLWLEGFGGMDDFPQEYLPGLSPQQLEQVFELALDYSGSDDHEQSYWGVELLETLAPRLSREQLRRALGVFRFTSLSIFNAGWLASGLPIPAIEALQQAVRRLPDGELVQQSVESLEKRLAVRREHPLPAHNPAEEEGMLPAVREMLPEAELERELGRIRDIEHPFRRARALAALAARLPEGQRSPLLLEALQICRTFEQDKQRAEFIRKQAGLLTGESAEAALQIVSELEGPPPGYTGLDQTALLLALAPRFPEPRRSEIYRQALQAALAQPDPQWRSAALYELAEKLPVEMLYPVLEGFWGLENPYDDYSIYANIEMSMYRLTQHWQEICRSAGKSEHEALSNTLRAFARAPRWLLEATLSDLLPIIYRLGGDEAVAEAVLADIDTRQWWA